ncbi:MAG: helix-turn-helix domain-containing protein [Eubacteriales bacterium]|nr:helix-turn-helix domain-containing protein [Eubacteriales bacterium]
MAAVTGEKEAVQKVVEHYSDYIDELCTFEEPQKDGTVKKRIDEDMRQTVILRLIESLPDFKDEL